MAHVIYDKATNEPLMIVLNATPVHEANLQRQCKEDATKGLHVIDKAVYEAFSKPEDVAAAIVEAVALDATPESSAVISDG